MIRHSFLLIYRNFKRSKTIFFINLAGLSTGLACTLLICLWVMDEWSFDRYHEKNDRLFQIMENEKTDMGLETSGHTQPFLAEVLAAEMPEIEHSITVTPPYFFPDFNVTANGKNVQGMGKYVDDDFFNMFSYKLLQGDPASVLSNKNAIVLSERMARRLFPDISDIVGQELEYQFHTMKKSVTITGVFRDLPRNSFEYFEFLLTFDAFRDIMRMSNQTLNWDGNAPFFTYVTLKDGVNAGHFNEKLSGLLAQKSQNAQHRTLFLKPFSDNYLYGRYDNGVATGRIEYVRLFTLIAAFILLIACINFMNLSTAKASRRLKEIGIKKAIGAQRKTLVFQYLAESMLMSFLALIIAILMVGLLLPHFNLITGKDLVLAFDGRIVTAFLGIAVVTGLIAGSYPALFLSRLNTAKVLQGKFKTPSSDLLARKGLVVFQFALSVIFIVAVLVVYRQIEFVQTKNLGYDRENVLYFETNGRVAINPETFLNEVKKMPGVVNASSMLGNLVGERGNTQGGGTRGTHSWEGKEVVMNVAQVNYDLIETLGIQIKAGRSFSRERGPDSLQIIYNEAAIDALGIPDPVGKILPDGTEIVGVAKNFHFQSLHENVEPHCLMLEPDYALTMMLKIRKGMESETVEALEKLYKSFNPGFEFGYKFLDERYQELYAAEQKVATLSGYFAGLTIVISCLGLFGLAAFTAERRIKEIGIRKVLGSSVFRIVYLLSAEFTKIVLLSIVIALPVSYLAAREWLKSFAFSVPLEWWYFAVAGLAAILIAWLTIGTQAFTAARVNPVKCLKDE
jgi:putative ABC transport system permease protein